MDLKMGIKNLRIEKWISSNKIEGADFWNEIGNKDVFNILSGDFSKFEKNISEHGFIKDFERCLIKLNNLGKRIEGTGIELAAGTMWLTSYILNKFQNQIKEYYALEMSESILLNLGVKVLEKYEVNCKKITICIGSFYEIKLPDESLDFMVICQAFHHADDPDQLLKEVHRVLKKGGFLIMIGELFISKRLYLKCYANYLISRVFSSYWIPKVLKNKIPILNKLSSKNLQGNFQEIYFPPDSQTGDHYHLKKQYQSFFENNSFHYIRIKAELPNHLSYILFKG